MFYIKHDSGVTVYLNGKASAVSDTHPQYNVIIQALESKDFALAVNLMSVVETINKAVRQSGNESRIFVDSGKVMYRDLKHGKVTELEGPLVNRILNAISKGLTAETIQPLVKFLDNVMKNKLKDIRKELYLFMMSGKMPITNDGHFLAYKKVRADFFDIFTGKFDNSPGKYVTMPQADVDTDRDRTCSHGLHFCTHDYLGSYGSTNACKVVIVKVNPRHVFAIPSDYNNAKGRCSEYFVVGEVTGEGQAFVDDMIFDENKLFEVAPTVKFVPSLKPSLKSISEGFGLSTGGVACVKTMDDNGPLETQAYTIVHFNEKTKRYVEVVTNKFVAECYVRVMSLETKSVRAAMVRAVAKKRNQ
jgi:hypothetical protein